MQQILYCALLFFVSSTYSAPSNLHDGMVFLAKYGYMDKSEMDRGKPNMKVVKKSLKKFQDRYNMKPTGKFDKATMNMMSKPRCGKMDILSNYRQDLKWHKNNLTFKINNYPDYFNKYDVARDIRRAFSIWSMHIPLTFEQTESDTADIQIGFETRFHGDNAPFDGPGGVLAHAYYPTDGRLHFDNDETWSMDSSEGTPFLQVATHEIGHALGLEHTVKTDPRIVMYPYVAPYTEDFDLAEEDVLRIKELYKF